VGSVSQVASQSLTGVEADGFVGAMSVPLGSAVAQGYTGEVTTNITVSLSGVGSSGAVGTVTMANRGATLTGVAVVAQVGSMTAIYWSLINDNQNPLWQNVSDDESPGWAGVNNSQTPTWTSVTNSDSPSWAAVSDADSPSWVEVPTQ
jgi:hypothetical protein